MRAFFALADRFAEGVCRSLKPVADLGQLSRREVDALLLDLRALLLLVGPLRSLSARSPSALQLGGHALDGPGELGQLPGDDLRVLFHGGVQSYAGGSVSNGSDSRIQIFPSAVSTAGEPSPGSVRSVRVTFTRLPSSSANGPCTGPMPNV